MADDLPFLEEGEIIVSGARRFHVSKRDLESVASMRTFLVDEARARATVTYGELVDTLRLPAPPKGLGRLLVLLSEDCARRGEPTLAAIVVRQSTGEVGDGYGAGARDDRAELFDYWASHPSGRHHA